MLCIDGLLLILIVTRECIAFIGKREVKCVGKINQSRIFRQNGNGKIDCDDKKTHKI